MTVQKYPQFAWHTLDMAPYKIIIFSKLSGTTWWRLRRGDLKVKKKNNLAVSLISIIWSLCVYCFLIQSSCDTRWFWTCWQSREVPWVPSAVFGGFCFLVALTSLLLPETKNKDLPQTVADLDKLCDQDSTVGERQEKTSMIAKS